MAQLAEVTIDCPGCGTGLPVALRASEGRPVGKREVEVTVTPDLIDVELHALTCDNPQEDQ